METAEKLENNETLPEEFKGPKVGIFSDVPNNEYHGGIGISKSGLDLIHQSPAHFITNKKHPKPSTPAMVIGSAFHALVLEPDVFEQEYVKQPVNAPKRPTAAQLNSKNPTKLAQQSIGYWEQFDKENAGKIILTNTPGDDPFWKPGDWDRIHRMRDAILEHPIASVLLDLDQGKAEQSVYWVDSQTHKLCKCRPDFINDAHNVAVDLKSTENASYTEFAKSCAKFRYHVQDPFYRDGLQAVGRPVDAFVFVAVEKTPPWGIGIYIIEPEARRIGRIEYQRDLEIYAQCHSQDEWPCYPNEVRDIELPVWGLKGKVI